ncbi:hypothetical protein [Chryseobacterium ginsenosidimutans]|uniref:hypothetical protein n=1 Tax=Chryseobacterium ginsenosidimutans TaxID=687846 RepID=UPI0031D65DC5
MKTGKIIRKFHEIGLSVGIKIESENRIRVDILKKHLDDPDLERILKAFPTKKYNITIKTSKDNLVLEISKIPSIRKAHVRPINVHPFAFPPIFEKPLVSGRFSSYNPFKL